MSADELRMYAIFRADLTIPDGKGRVQAGHAFEGALLRALDLTPEIARRYTAAGGRMKVCLAAADQAALEAIARKAEARGVAHFLVTDEGRTVFDRPTVTCLGLGPAARSDGNALTRGLKLL